MKPITDAELEDSRRRYPSAAQAVADVIDELDPKGVVRAFLAGSTFAERMADDPGFVVTAAGEEPPPFDFNEHLDAMMKKLREAADANGVTLAANDGDCEHLGLQVAGGAGRVEQASHPAHRRGRSKVVGLVETDPAGDRVTLAAARH